MRYSAWLEGVGRRRCCIEMGDGCAGSFVVNDDGLGYMDVGEEDWFGSEEPVAVGRRMDAALSKKGPMTKKRGPNDDGEYAPLCDQEAFQPLPFKFQCPVLEIGSAELQ